MRNDNGHLEDIYRYSSFVKLLWLNIHFYRIYEYVFKNELHYLLFKVIIEVKFY